MTVEGYQNIIEKLEGFNRRYYIRMLVKGLIMFSLLGLLILLGVLFLEYLLWMGPAGRTLLFWLGLATEIYLLVRFIIRPLVYLFRFRRGISHKQASLFIGKHFPAIGDKLYNLLDLQDDKEKTELLEASIDQRSKELSPVPFAQAVNFKDTWRLGKWLLIPLLLLGLIWGSGNLPDFFGSYNRVVNYSMAYQPPAPFEFEVLMGDLMVLETNRFTVQVRTRGKVKPDGIMIHYQGRNYFLQEEGGVYSYTFEPPLQSLEFHFSAAGIQSGTYQLRALKVPTLEDFSMQLQYPAYLNRQGDLIKSTGNAVIPEGTRVTWRLKGRNTGEIVFGTEDSLQNFTKEGDVFNLTKRLSGNVNYRISTSNENVENFEELSYKVTVVRDAYPQIKVEEIRDSLDIQDMYFKGEASDDYKLTHIGMVAYPEGDERNSQVVTLMEPQSNFEQFYYSFPTGLVLEPGITYELYFTATDNDAIHHKKTSRSSVFKIRLLSERELDQQRLEWQEEIIGGMGKTLKEFKEEADTYDKIQQQQKEKSSLNFKDQQQIKDFLQKQKRQEELMEKFSRELKDNMEERDSDAQLNKMLKERLERREKEARKNAKLLEELSRLADKIDKEELAKRLEELGKQRQSNQRSLEQILELTKRYYVTEKAAELSRELELMSIEQKALAKSDLKQKDAAKAQDSLNSQFSNKEKEIDELREDNRDLKKPLELGVTRQDQEAVREDQQRALEELQKQMGEDDAGNIKKGPTENGNSAKKRQQSAGDKLEEMSRKMQQAGNSSQGRATIAEDAEMLRQILDNLITFSFKQEVLFEKMEGEGGELYSYSEQVRDQQELRELFGHIDDSLFALSLRRAEISELVNEQITEVYYNIDKALESIAENRIYQGVSYQQYVFTAANTLANFLASLLDNMQESLSMGSGNGDSGQGFQLPDIIKSQGELRGKMGQMGKSGEQGQQGNEGEGRGKEQGDAEKGTNSTREATQGNEGKQGQDGNQAGEEGRTNGSGGDGELSEQELQEIYDIYKQQQQIREALENQLEDMMQERDRELARKLLKQMESFENELLENGITEQTINRINRIEHELLKLENAALKQGEKKERESRANKKTYVNPVVTKPTGLENYTNDIEILNRQALPLQKIYQDKVKDYFKAND